MSLSTLQKYRVVPEARGVCKTRLTHEGTLQLIEAVRKQDCLLDIKYQSFINYTEYLSAWNSVITELYELGCKDADCAFDTWCNLCVAFCGNPSEVNSAYTEQDEEYLSEMDRFLCREAYVFLLQIREMNFYNLPIMRQHFYKEPYTSMSTQQPSVQNYMIYPMPDYDHNMVRMDQLMDIPKVPVPTQPDTAEPFNPIRTSKHEASTAPSASETVNMKAKRPANDQKKDEQLRTKVDLFEQTLSAAKTTVQNPKRLKVKDLFKKIKPVDQSIHSVSELSQASQIMESPYTTMSSSSWMVDDLTNQRKEAPKFSVPAQPGTAVSAQSVRTSKQEATTTPKAPTPAPSVSEHVNMKTKQSALDEYKKMQELIRRITSYELSEEAKDAGSLDKSKPVQDVLKQEKEEIPEYMRVDPFLRKEWYEFPAPAYYTQTLAAQAIDSSKVSAAASEPSLEAPQPIPVIPDTPTTETIPANYKQNIPELSDIEKIDRKINGLIRSKLYLIEDKVQFPFTSNLLLDRVPVTQQDDNAFTKVLINKIDKQLIELVKIKENMEKDAAKAEIVACLEAASADPAKLHEISSRFSQIEKIDKKILLLRNGIVRIMNDIAIDASLPRIFQAVSVPLNYLCRSVLGMDARDIEELEKTKKTLKEDIDKILKSCTASAGTTAVPESTNKTPQPLPNIHNTSVPKTELSTMNHFIVHIISMFIVMFFYYYFAN